MLARTADNLFWLARSMERADFIARTIEATLRLEYLPRSGVDDPAAEWESALNAAGDYDEFIAEHGAVNEGRAIDFLTFDRANPSSICNCLENARANGRAVRTALTVETWTAINDAWLELKRFEATGPRQRPDLEALTRFLDYVRRPRSIRRRVLSNHAAQRRMVIAWDFHRARRQHPRLLDVKYPRLLPSTEAVGGPLDYFQWVAILRVRPRPPTRAIAMGEALADRRSPDPEDLDAALADLLLRQHRQRARRAGAGGRPQRRRAASGARDALETGALNA